MGTSAEYVVIEKAIRFLEEDFKNQPSLDELATHVGLSKFHLQRLFSRWAGVSPKRFLQFLTVEHAKELLRDSEPVLSAAFSSGLSGPARLHDLFITTEGVTPGEFKAGGGGVDITYGVHDTPFGRGLLARTERGLCHLSFLESEDPKDEEVAIQDLQAAWPRASMAENPEETASVSSAIFQRKPPRSSPSPLSLFLKGTNFQIKVWNALLKIPPGAVTTYGGLAGALGAPGAARAVGTAVGRNPIAFLIPCHRVIRQMGVFGGYRWGSARKQAILGWEAARKVS